MKDKYENISLKWKLFLYLIGFCGLLLVLLWLLQVVFLDFFYKNVRIRTVKQTANIVAENLDNSNIQSIINEISIKNDVNVEVFDDRGITLCKTHNTNGQTTPEGRPPFLDPTHSKSSLYNKTLLNGGKFLELSTRENVTESTIILKDSSLIITASPASSRPNDKEVLSYAEIIPEENGHNLLISINSLISPVDATTSTIRIQLYLVTIFMVLFSIILAFLLARKISLPIETINKRAKNLVDNDFNTTFHATGYKEIKELSDTLNETAVELSKVESLRRELIANVSHDLRTPLTLITGFAEIMRDIPGENNAENAQTIIDETSRLTTLVNDLLDISQYQAIENNIHVEKYNLTESIERNLSRVQELVRKDDYTIKFQYDTEVFVTADELKISQVLYNLVINAINYTGEDKVVTVRQILKDHKVTIEVSDTGEGIPEDKLDFIWERYYKLDEHHKRGVTGSGIGLSIVKSVIEDHGGQYGVNSTPGEGSTFWFTLDEAV